MDLDKLLQSKDLPGNLRLEGAELTRLINKYKGLLKQRERDGAFWEATNENLKKAYEKLDEQEKELARAYGIIQEDLSVASKIQQALLPEPLPTMEAELELAVYHKQLAEVGGDYYDYFNTRTGRYAIGVFDISGHGVSAALVMTYLKAQFMTAMEAKDSPKEIVESINQTSYAFLRTIKKYATVNFVLVEKDRLRYVCGGGFGLLVSGKRSTPFLKRDPFLGLRTRPYHEVELPLRKNDILALYTDGIVEAQNEAGEDYTVDRLQRMILKSSARRPGDMLEAIIQDYRGFRKADSDDITLLIARKKA